MNLAEVFNQAPEVVKYQEVLSKGELQDFTVYQEQKKIETIVQFSEIISKQLIFSVAKSIRETYGLSVIKLFTRYPSALFSAAYYSEILTYISLKMPGVKQFIEGSTAVYQDGVLAVQLVGGGAPGNS